MDGVKLIRLKVKGMTCGGCAANVRRILAALPGAISAEVDLAGGAAELSCREGQVPPAAAAAALAAAGYEARVLPS